MGRTLRLGRHCAALPFDWELDEQCGPAAGGTGDFEGAAKRLDAIAEPDQSRPAAGVGSPEPVVADRQLQDRVMGVELDLHDGCCACLGAFVNASDTT